MIFPEKSTKLLNDSRSILKIDESGLGVPDQSTQDHPNKQEVSHKRWIQSSDLASGEAFFLALGYVEKMWCSSEIVGRLHRWRTAKKQQVVQMQQVRGEQKFAYHADSILSKDVKGILIFQSIQHVYTIVLPTWRHWKMHLRTHHNPPGDSDKWATTFTSWWVSYTKRWGSWGLHWYEKLRGIWFFTTLWRVKLHLFI